MQLCAVREPGLRWQLSQSCEGMRAPHPCRGSWLGRRISAWCWVLWWPLSAVWVGTVGFPGVFKCDINNDVYVLVYLYLYVMYMCVHRRRYGSTL